MSTKPISIYQVDAFTAEPFAGNPAAVCPLNDERDADWMQAVATEMNLSETAFLRPREDGFELRWFTPTVEVSLCGHATLASAHVLWESGALAGDADAVFHTKSGRHVATRAGDGIELDFPLIRVTESDAPERVRAAVEGAPIRAVARFVEGCIEEENYVVELESEAAVRALQPNLTPLRAKDAPGLVVTARADTEGIDFVSRYFCPFVGIDEDPVTGVVHCGLAGWWRDRLGRDGLVGYQASARGGYVGTRVVGDRVKLHGRAVTVLSGHLRV